MISCARRIWFAENRKKFYSSTLCRISPPISSEIRFCKIVKFMLLFFNIELIFSLRTCWFSWWLLWDGGSTTTSTVNQSCALIWSSQWKTVWWCLVNDRLIWLAGRPAWQLCHWLPELWSVSGRCVWCVSGHQVAASASIRIRCVTKKNCRNLCEAAVYREWNEIFKKYCADYKASIRIPASGCLLWFKRLRKKQFA